MCWINAFNDQNDLLLINVFALNKCSIILDFKNITSAAKLFLQFFFCLFFLTSSNPVEPPHTVTKLKLRANKLVYHNIDC